MKRKMSHIGFLDSFLDVGSGLGIVGFERDYGSEDNSDGSFEGPGDGHGYGRATEEEDGDVDIPF